MSAETIIDLAVALERIAFLENRVQDLLEANNREVARRRITSALLAEVQADCNRLKDLIGNPQTADFLESVRSEAAHQVERWGPAHDRSKSAENWFWLVGYLAGKALRAQIEGDREKALHHTISSAAALAHWHAAIMADENGRGVGDDHDLVEIERFHRTPGTMSWPPSHRGGSSS
jgi:hypothetical protein